MSELVLFDSPCGPVAFTAEQITEGRKMAAEILPADVGMTTALPTYKFIDAAEAESIFKVKASWFLQQARERRIPHLKVGRYVRFDLEELRSAIEKRSW